MVQQDWSDDDLAQRLHERNPEALETLISRYSREIYYFIRVVLDGIELRRMPKNVSMISSSQSGKRLTRLIPYGERCVPG